MINQLGSQLDIIKGIHLYRRNMFIIVFMCFLCLLSINYYFYSQNQQKKNVLLDAKQSNQAEATLHYISSHIDESFLHAQDNLRLLFKDPLLPAYLKNEDPSLKRKIEEKWKLLLESSTRYTQLRLLDLEGKEVIRINYASQHKHARIAKQLQDKSNRHYFTQGKELSEGQIGITAFDEEQEFGVRLTPSIMAGRLISPLYIRNQKIAYIVMNLDMKKVIEKVKEQQVLSQQMVAIIDNKGKPIYTSHEELKNQWLFTKDDYIDDFNAPKGKLLKFSKTVTYRWLNITGAHKSKQNDSSKLLLLSVDNRPQVSAEGFKDFIISNSFSLSNLSLLFLASLLLGWTMNFSLQRKRVQAFIYNAISNTSAMAIVNDAFEIIGVSEEFERLSGFDAKSLKSVLANEFFIGHSLSQERIDSRQVDGWQGEASILCKNGESKSVWLDIKAILHTDDTKNRNQFFIFNLVDTSKQKERERRLSNYAYIDELTGLHNRRYFNEQLTVAHNMAKRYKKSSYCLAIIDIDYFKNVNDKFGHDTGDKILQKFALCLPVGLREIDQCFRIGGEEFAVILPFTDLTSAQMVLNRLRLHVKNSLKKPQITCSIGISNFSQQKESKQIFKEADVSLYKAKSSGRDNVQAFNEQALLEKELNISSFVAKTGVPQ